MHRLSITTFDRQVLLHTDGTICADSRQIVESDSFAQVVRNYVEHLLTRNDTRLKAFPTIWGSTGLISRIVQTMRLLTKQPLPSAGAGGAGLLAELVTYGQIHRLRSFLDGLYDWWRAQDRLMLIHSEQPELPAFRTFTDTVEAFNREVRTLYRELRDHVVGHPVRTYRQLAAGCSAGIILSTIIVPDLPAKVQRVVEGIPFIRTLWMAPPLLLEPAATKRGGGFLRLGHDPMDDLVIDRENWFCFPAQVGPLVILAYVHARFASLGISLANLFELTEDKGLGRTPDAICLFGVPEALLPAEARRVPSFYDNDQKPIVGLIPDTETFAYFGYLKKTMLLLHNVVMMQRGRMPFHGAMLTIELESDRRVGLLVIGDTGTGKSETIEALRQLKNPRLLAIEIIADDMGSMIVDDQDRLVAFGTETGAFVRLDDLDQGYAFQTIDRGIFMNPHAENARVVLPVTSLRAVLAGTPVDLLLYANNHEEVDAAHPVLERFADPSAALRVFSEGRAMSKGTTTSTGLVCNYFANIFGPPDYRSQHEHLAEQVFAAAFAKGILVGQLRTRLGLPGQGRSGPKAAALALLQHLLPSSLDQAEQDPA